MKKHVSVSDINRLSVEERIELIQILWNSIEESSEPVELTEEQVHFLDERLSLFMKDHESGAPWEIVKKRIKESS